MAAGSRRSLPLDGGVRVERGLPGTPLRADAPAPSVAPPAARGGPHGPRSPLGGHEGGARPRYDLRWRRPLRRQLPRGPPAAERTAAPSTRGGCRPPRQTGPRGRRGLAYRAARPERPRSLPAGRAGGWEAAAPAEAPHITEPRRPTSAAAGGGRAGAGGGGGGAAPRALPDG